LGEGSEEMVAANPILRNSLGFGKQFRVWKIRSYETVQDLGLGV
jgi:hypothetical protein